MGWGVLENTSFCVCDFKNSFIVFSDSLKQLISNSFIVFSDSVKQFISNSMETNLQLVVVITKL
jgi:hypothetical protein